MLKFYLIAPLLIALMLFSYSSAEQKEYVVHWQTKVDDLIYQHHQKENFKGVVAVAVQDSLIYAKNIGKANIEWGIYNQIDTKFRIASITKTFTSALILKLIQDGELSLDDPVHLYLPDNLHPQNDKITIHHLLSQTSGIPDYCELPDFMDKISRIEHDRYEFPNYFINQELEFEPGTDWTYGNSEYYLLGLIAEHITGQSYEKAVYEYILKPLELNDTGFIKSNNIVTELANGYKIANGSTHRTPGIDPSVCYSAGSMYSNASDLIKWSYELFNQYSLLDRDHLSKMTSIVAEDYGYGIYIGEQTIHYQPVLTYTQLGNIHGYAAQISYFPDYGKTIVILNNTQMSITELFLDIRNFIFKNDY